MATAAFVGDDAAGSEARIPLHAHANDDLSRIGALAPKQTARRFRRESIPIIDN